ncbi:Aerobactin synthase [Aquicella siphonis]|uniref:Aerobactin synthase n=1 Tax=Aquicella siphonis TaxID=254247 RepID=A0A5E4PGP0_9COXI|nr:IucA/IucC family protein [Aquicella siphonis]VVC75755.1 Aerobactin synthase [Aquicella siphonis]
MTANATPWPSPNTENQLIKRLLHACVREQLLSHVCKDSLLLISLPRSKKTIIASKVQQFQLGKLKIDGEIFLISQSQFQIITRVDHLLSLIRLELSDMIDPSQWDKFAAEINNCNINKNLVEGFSRNFNHQLARELSQFNANSLFEYVNSRLTPAEQLMFFESWAAKGHPYHPCHKTKLGFSTKAYQKYSPEFNQDILLPLAAVDKSIIHLEKETEQDFTEWFSLQFPDAWKAWTEKMRASGLAADAFYPLFIHPWQYENVITKLFHTFIDNGKLIYFRDIYVTTKASLSFRTLMIKNDSGQPHIKLPVAVHSTSAMRTISPASVHNGPRLGKILRQILDQEKHFGGRLKLAYESYSMHVHFANPEIEKHLGIIYRDNPVNLLDKNETPIVVAALFEESPLHRVPLFIEMIHMGAGNSLNDAIAYFSEYCRIVIQAYLDLFLVYGIALEGHQQNTIAVFRHHHPVRMIARDLGGLRIHAPTLYEQGYILEAHPQSATITQDRQEVTNKFLHTVIQYHLGEIILLLAQEYRAPESVFWKLVKSILHARFHEIREKVNPQRWQEEYQAVMEDDWQIKGLMRMRLNNLYNKYIYIHLKNPLRDS